MSHVQYAGLFAAIAMAPALLAQSDMRGLATNAAFTVTISVDAGKSTGALKPI